LELRDLVRENFLAVPQLPSLKGLLPEEHLRAPVLRLTIGRVMEFELCCSADRLAVGGEKDWVSREGSLAVSLM